MNENHPAPEPGQGGSREEHRKMGDLCVPKYGVIIFVIDHIGCRKDMLLEPMTKERLSSFFSLKMQTENHLERITRLKSKAQFLEMRENDGSSSNPGAGDPMGNTIVKHITYQEEISVQLEANLVKMEAIPKAVLSLDDRNE